MIKKIMSLILALCICCSFASCKITDTGDNKEYGDDETITYKWLIPTQQQSSVYHSKIVQELRRKFNVEFEFSAYPTGEQFNNKKQLALTGEGEYDIYSWLEKDEANEYGSEDFFVDLEGYTQYMPNIMAILKANPSSKYNLYNADGAIYMFPVHETDKASSSLEFSVVDKRLSAAGKTIEDLSTWQGFYDALVAMKNGQKDKYPFHVRTKALDVQNFLYPFVMSFTKGVTGYYSVTTPAFDYNTKTYKIPFEVDGYKEAIDFIKSLYTAELINPNHVAADAVGSITTSIKQNDAAITFDYNGGLSGLVSVSDDIHLEKPNYNLVPFVLPQTGVGNEVYGIRSLAFSERGTALSSYMSESKKIRAIKMLDWLYSEEAYNLLYWHEDVTSVDDEGNKYYKNEDIYKSTASVVDVYLPWSMTALFNADYYTTFKGENVYAQFRNDFILNEENNSKYVQPVAVAFTFDEQEEISTLQYRVNTYFLMNISGMMKGTATMSWETFVGELKTRGITRITEIYNQAYQRLYSNT